MKSGKMVVILLLLAGIGAVVAFRLVGQKGTGTFFGIFQKRYLSPSGAREIYYCPMHPTYTSDRPGDCPICNMRLVPKKSEQQTERKILYYRHPMGQPDISPVPKKDSMGMDYIPVYQDEAPETAGPKKIFSMEEFLKLKPGEICLLHKCKMGTCNIIMTEEFARLGKCPHCGEDLGVIVKDLLPTGYGDVKLTPEKQQLIGIKTAPVSRMAITKTVRTVGRVAYDPQLYQAQEEFIQAMQSLKKAQGGTIPEITDQAAKLVDSALLRLKLLGLGEELIKELETSQKPDRSLLYSEAGGTAWLYASIYEYEIPLVKVGDPVEVQVPAIPGRKFQGTIRSIDSVLDSMTRSVRVRAILENPEGLLKPEMYVNAILKIDLGEVLVVPEEAVFKTGEADIVFVAKPDGLFEPRHVIMGVKSEKFQEIKAGLSEGEGVVVSGNFLIDSESRLKGALESMSGGSHQHGNA